MADLISSRNSSSSGTVSSSSSSSAGGGSTSFSPAVIAIVGILGTAFLLVSYYTMVAKFCRGRDRRRLGGWAAGWRTARNGRANEAELEQEAQAQAQLRGVQQQGLQQAEIEAIPVVLFLRRARSGKSLSKSNSKSNSRRGGSGALDCAVCLSEFEEAERVRLLPSCCHAFHLPCIDVWLRSHDSCPLCRTPIHSHTTILDGAEYPLLLSAGPTMPSLFRADSGRTSSPPLPPAAPPYRLNPIPGDENELHLSWPSSTSTSKVEALSVESAVGDLVEQEQDQQKLGMQSSPIKQQLQDLKIGRGWGWGRGGSLGLQRRDFSFGRCFSTGRSSIDLLLVDDANQYQVAPQTQQSSPLHSRIDRTNNYMMQRSSSYSSMGGSIFPLLQRQSPILHYDDQLQMMMLANLQKAGASSSLPYISSPCSSSATGSSLHDVIHCNGASIVTQSNGELRSKNFNHHIIQVEEKILKRVATTDATVGSKNLYTTSCSFPTTIDHLAQRPTNDDIFSVGSYSSTQRSTSRHEDFINGGQFDHQCMSSHSSKSML